MGIIHYKWKIHYFYGKSTINYGKSPCLMGKLTIAMAIFNSYVKLPEGNQAKCINLRNEPAKLGNTPTWRNIPQIEAG